MPGILPMKVIKVGTTAQSRIAQACDRCRSKKIRCDGITPCCSQCANVGFECKTSDKLSRRAFPRGYTESLEERVRLLENEVKELKDLLDEKDEKIDILSRIHSHAPSSRRPSSTLSDSGGAPEVKQTVDVEGVKEDTFRVQQSPNLLDDVESDSYFMGASSGRHFVDTFRAKVQESGKPCADFKTETFFSPRKRDAPSPKRSPTATVSKAPPRMVSDQMINIFFQEWAPMFPVVHRPTFLKTYADYVSDPEKVEDQHSLAQLHLVFGISALSAEWNKQNAADFEMQWQAALESVMEENTLPTLQCLILAQIYCIAKADYKKLLRYKGMSIGLSHRLGLHQSQTRFSLGALTSETRKRVFWTMYTLDCFSAALLGLPKLLNEDDIHAEYPADVDDENVSERGFQSSLPGELTRVSSALALFRVARIMSKVLDENYPAALSHDLSLQKIGALNDELDAWLGQLPQHLRLHFVQDKPSTDVTGSRSPLMSLAYHYVRTLIHRPAVGSTLGNRAETSVHALAQSSKHIIQIAQLLEERRMSFSFCLNKNEVLLLAGFGLLFQTLNCDHKGKLIQGSQRLLCSVISILERNAAPGAADFKKVACAMISVDRLPKSAPEEEEPAARRKSDGTMPAPKEITKTARKLSALASRLSSMSNPSLKSEKNAGRRSTLPNLSTGFLPIYARRDSQNSASSAVSDPIPRKGRKGISNYSTTRESPHQVVPLNLPNLDYLDFSNDGSSNSTYASPIPSDNSRNAENKQAHGAAMTQQEAQPSLDILFSGSDMFSYISPSPSAPLDWSTDVWPMSQETVSQSQAAQSVLSFSEEELTSGEDFASYGVGGSFDSMNMSKSEGLVGLEGLDVNFGL